LLVTFTSKAATDML